MNMASSQYWLLIFASAVACSKLPTSKMAGSQSPRPEPVVVTMGGYNSCRSDSSGKPTPMGTERWKKSARISSKYAAARELWVRACFDTKANIHYVSSASPNTVKTASVSDPLPFFKAIDAHVVDESTPVFLIGHSHGGWLAMYTAFWLPSDVPVKRLFTVDPISPRSCTSESYYSSLLSKSALQGCQASPGDFSEAELSKIVNRLPAQAWSHFYQRNFLPLRSSAFTGSAKPGLSQDLSPFLKVGPGAARPSIVAHIAIDDLSLVWHGFETVIGLDLQNLGQAL